MVQGSQQEAGMDCPVGLQDYLKRFEALNMSIGLLNKRLGAKAPLVPRSVRPRCRLVHAPLCVEEMKGACGARRAVPVVRAMSWADLGSDWEEDPVVKAMDECQERQILTDETLASPDGEVLRYIADEVYKKLFVHMAGRKPHEQLWDDYVVKAFNTDNDWFRERRLDYPELAVLLAALHGRPEPCCHADSAWPRPREVMDDVVRTLGEEWEHLWANVRPSD